MNMNSDKARRRWPARGGGGGVECGDSGLEMGDLADAGVEAADDPAQFGAPRDGRRWWPLLIAAIALALLAAALFVARG